MMINKIMFMTSKKKLKTQSNKFICQYEIMIELQKKNILFSAVTAKDLEQTLRLINPHIQANELAHVVQWTFEAKDGSQTPSMGVHDVLKRLQNGVFYRQHSLA